MQQLNLFGSALRDIGIEQAETHANDVHEDWSQKAYNFLLLFIRENTVFQAEDVREASLVEVPEPPSNRAWGAIIVRAIKAGLIKRIGYAPVNNKKAHCTPASVWQVVK